MEPQFRLYQVPTRGVPCLAEKVVRWHYPRHPGNMLQFLVIVVSWLLSMCFAVVWGAHLYQVTVLFPIWASDPPKSVIEWLATPYAMRVPGFFRTVVSLLYTFASIALIVAVVSGMRMRPAIVVAGVCALIHLVLNLLIFLPTNLKLGFDQGDPAHRISIRRLPRRLCDDGADGTSRDLALRRQD